MANYWYTGGAPLISKNAAGGFGTLTAALCFAGSSPLTVDSEEYNVTSWSAIADYGLAVNFISGCGTTTAGLGAGGRNATDAVNNVYEYNGTSWSAGGTMINKRRSHPTFGTQTAGCAATGLHDSTAWRQQTEEYDGTSWTASNNTTSVQVDGAYGGAQTAGLLVCGQDSAGTRLTTVEEYDGTTWANAGAVSVAVYRLGGFGSQTAFIRCGGDEAGTAITKTESYNGTTWATENSMPGGKTFNASAGDATSGLTISLTVTYEWDPNLYIAGTLDGLSTITGAVGLERTFSGSISALSSLVAALSYLGRVDLAGSITGLSNISGILGFQLWLSGSISGAAVITGALGDLNELYLLVTGFPSGQTVQYRIKDKSGTMIQDWTSTGVNEDVEITGKSTYYINVMLNSGFQGKISWKIASTNYYSVDGINHFELLLAQLNSLPTLPEIEASTVLTKLDVPVSSRAPEIPTLRTQISYAPQDLTRVRKNTMLADFTFFLVSSVNYRTPVTGATVTAQRSLDGAAYAACANSVTEIGNGFYKITLAAADLNGYAVSLKFTATGAADRIITIKTIL